MVRCNKSCLSFIIENISLICLSSSYRFSILKEYSFDMKLNFICHIPSFSLLKNDISFMEKNSPIIMIHHFQIYNLYENKNYKISHIERYLIRLIKHMI